MTFARTGGMSSPNQNLVLYDGVCGLCNKLVAFLLHHDRRDQFWFAPKGGINEDFTVARRAFDDSSLHAFHRPSPCRVA
jgi:predicted DCC family thiol-disulfide oxidoreductase YuxK